MMKINSNLKTLSVFIVIMILFAGCAKWGLNIFSDQDEVNLGMQLDQEIRKNPKEYPIYSGDPSVKNYIYQNIFLQILNSPEIKKRNVYKYQLELIQDDNTLNAFATPGGFVYVYTGILKYLDSEAALAGVLAHEIAHAERRHATQNLTSYYGISMLASLVLGENPNEIAQIAANLFTGLTFLANSRTFEDEADEYSIKYLRATRFYPGGVKFFFEKMRDDKLIDTQPSKVKTFLSTHPDPIDRIKTAEARLRNYGIPIKDYKSNDPDVYRQSYQTNIKAKLR
ncbi:MAG: M48 family metalloprotease [Ignavibacteria bacterium]|jgi:predicted Zn-dependent protease|nr:M48 family metalloprotease [Ignavibacteria bacterium]MDH7527139.1 M48 family metalloprotease [Ignavibacteria bacterium]